MNAQIKKIIFSYGDNNGITVNNDSYIKIYRTNNKQPKVYKHKPGRFNAIFDLTQLWHGDYTGIWSRTTTLYRVK